MVTSISPAQQPVPEVGRNLMGTLWRDGQLLQMGPSHQRPQLLAPTPLGWAPQGPGVSSRLIPDSAGPEAHLEPWAGQIAASMAWGPVFLGKGSAAGLPVGHCIWRF